MSDERRQRAVAYLLGELDEPASSAFELECASDQELAGLVDGLRPVVGRLESLPDDAWEPPEPPPLVMPGTPPVSTAPRARVATRPRFGWLLAGAGLATALVVLGAGILIGTQLDGDGGGSPAGPTLALEPEGEGPPGAAGEVILASTGGDGATLDVSGLEPTREGEFYELWLLGDDGDLVALGSFRVEQDGASEIEVPLPVSPDEYDYFDVSIQSDNGDPDHSGRSVLRGTTSA